MQKIKQALEDLKQGKMLVVIDDEFRENEGDLIIAAEKVTAADINFMVKRGGGLICLAMTGRRLDELQVKFMQSDRVEDDYSTPFTISIDARYGITTGISAAERAHTILTAVNPAADAGDLVRPGHIFPLRARDNGVLERPGHTEAAVDLARLAGLQPAGVICEILGEDGTMLRGEALKEYAKQYHLTMISVQELIAYREQHDQQAQHLPHHPTHRMQKTADSTLTTNYGNFHLQVFRDRVTQLEHTALIMGDMQQATKPLIRVHSSCLTGDVFASQLCDCGEQLHLAMEQIAAEKHGVIVYLNQEGRGVGLSNKIRAYALQQQGHDTVSANLALGLPVDAREYSIAADMLQQLGVKNCRLLTNNPQKISVLSALMNTTIERVPLKPVVSEVCQRYLQAKRDHLGHLL